MLIYALFVHQPPAFARETPQSIKEYIEETYLLPRLDSDVFSPEKVGRQWDFDWFDKAKVHLEPSLPRSVVIPTWELPFRCQKIGSQGGIWEPNSVQVWGSLNVFVYASISISVAWEYKIIMWRYMLFTVSKFIEF